MPSWDTSLVTNMSNAFSQYPDFNADISGWDTSNVVDMSAMFESASLFDQDISSWVTSEVRSMTRMFEASLVQSKHWGLLGYIASEEHGRNVLPSFCFQSGHRGLGHISGEKYEVHVQR